MAKKKATKKSAIAKKKPARKSIAKKKSAKKKSATKKSARKKAASKKTGMFLVRTDEKSKAKIQATLPGHELSQFEMWVRKPDAKGKQRLVTLARLCGQKKSCISAIEQE